MVSVRVDRTSSDATYLLRNTQHLSYHYIFDMLGVNIGSDAVSWNQENVRLWFMEVLLDGRTCRLPVSPETRV